MNEGKNESTIVEQEAASTINSSSQIEPVESTQMTVKKKKKTPMIFAVLLCIILVCLIVFVIIIFGDQKKEKVEDKQEVQSQYRMSGNALEDFDLTFLKLENEDKNIIYSPLSIKYALEMLSEGASGNTKEQLDAVIGDYEAKKYENSANMSFANAMFIRDSFKEKMKEKYMNQLATKYNAELIFDTFSSTDTINHWVQDKTLGLINNLVDDVNGKQFFLVNSLAIDMDWNNIIQATCNEYKRQYSVRYAHENYSVGIPTICDDKYSSLAFNNNQMNAKAVEIGASINRYDIINELGEENIRNTITQEYTEWCLLEEERRQKESDARWPLAPLTPVDEYVNQFIKELSENYQQITSSTDFLFYVDDEVKAFAKDLKEYNGTTLQYVGIMPKEKDLNTYLQEIDAENITNIISKLKEIKLENFTPGKVTKITGMIPLFHFDYDLKLMDDLKKLGVQDVFSESKADLSAMTSAKGIHIDQAIHKANIEFSNEGIKAAAATQMFGWGAGGGGFEHLYEVPLEIIDLTFDKPYLFLIRDKNSGEVWFVGRVQQPTESN